MFTYSCSYFEGSDSDSEDGVGGEGESEEAVRKRIAAEYQQEGLWSTTSVEQGQEEEEVKGDDDDDPLDAFMAGIEVNLSLCLLVKGRHQCTYLCMYRPVE